MTQDLTKITTPFGLLDKDTQDALRAHGGPYEAWMGQYWAPDGGPDDPALTDDLDEQTFLDDLGKTVIRVQPKPREWWAVQTVGSDLHIGMWSDLDDAHRAASECDASTEIFLVREVL